MAFDTISDRARKLIADDEAEAAADLLIGAFRAKNSSKLLNLAISQQAAIRSLAAQKMTGAMSPAEFAAAKGQIDAAILVLADEQKRRFEASFLPLILKIGAVAVALGLAFLGWKKMNEAQKMASVFDLEIRLHEPSGEQKTVASGLVNVRFGDDVPQLPRPLDASGAAVFRELSQKYRGDSIRLVFQPQPARPFSIKNQSAATASGERQTVRFVIEFLAEKTLFEAVLRDAKGRVLPDATVTVDALRTKTDANGYFKIEVPKASGAVAHVVIERGGRAIFEQDLTISAGLKPISVE